MLLSPTALQFYKQQVKEWLEDNIIEEQNDIIRNSIDKANGPFNINAFHTFSGKDRIIHNFKAINSLIEDDTNLIPGIDEAFDKISKSKTTIYSRIDLKSAYLQIPLRKSDQFVCSFTCDGKRYKFIIAPLGLKIIPSQFQRWLKSLLQSFQCTEFTVNHLDDIIVFRKSCNEHAIHL